jgi:hypothetical protein
MTISIWLYVGTVMSVYFFGRYDGQRTSEKINDTNKKAVLAICDTVKNATWLTVDQKNRLSDAIIDTFPPKVQKFINAEVEKELARRGL